MGDWLVIRRRDPLVVEFCGAVYRFEVGEDDDLNVQRMEHLVSALAHVADAERRAVCAAVRTRSLGLDARTAAELDELISDLEDG
jgi:hypothetical protein